MTVALQPRTTRDASAEPQLPSSQNYERSCHAVMTELPRGIMLILKHFQHYLLKSGLQRLRDMEQALRESSCEGKELAASLGTHSRVSLLHERKRLLWHIEMFTGDFFTREETFCFSIDGTRRSGLRLELARTHPPSPRTASAGRGEQHGHKELPRPPALFPEGDAGWGWGQCVRGRASG